MSTRVTVHQVHHDGAEDVVVAPSGRHEGSVYTGTVDGAVLRVGPDGSVEQVGSTGGRPLGLEIDPEGRLLVCDAHRGLLRMDPDTGAVERLLAEVAYQLQGVRREAELHLAFSEGKKRAWLFEQDLVRSETQVEDGFDLVVIWTPRQEAQFLAL